jgi:hypothetical protein
VREEGQIEHPRLSVKFMQPSSGQPSSGCPFVLGVLLFFFCSFSGCPFVYFPFVHFCSFCSLFFSFLVGVLLFFSWCPFVLFLGVLLFFSPFVLFLRVSFCSWCPFVLFLFFFGSYGTQGETDNSPVGNQRAVSRPHLRAHMSVFFCSFRHPLRGAHDRHQTGWRIPRRFLVALLQQGAARHAQSSSHLALRLAGCQP